jgi:molecular chaperone IbpA
MINDPWGKYPEPWKKPWSPYEEQRRKEQFNQMIPASKAMEPITIASLFPHLDRIAIGWDGILEDLKKASTVKPSYPPYDVVKLDGGIFIISLAVAGFSRDELEVVLAGNKLTVAGSQGNEEPNGEVLHNGIAKRDFTLNFRLADGVTLDSARLEDGILTIHLKKDLPEAEKPKQIEIK